MSTFEHLEEQLQAIELELAKAREQLPDCPRLDGAMRALMEVLNELKGKEYERI